MTLPDLHVFAISHYCEKARWALDYRDIDYRLNTLPPGAHSKKAKSLGLKRGSLPILETGNSVVQGSADIVSWADSIESGGPALTSDANREDCLSIENRLDETLGIHVRRYYYSEALVDHSHEVRPFFLRRIPFFESLKTRLSWPMIRKFMIKAMDLGPEQQRESRTIVETELDWLDGMLSDGREVLVGDAFTRADLAAASILAPLAEPDNHPEYAGIQLPPIISSDLAAWADRPSLHYVRNIYRQYRS